MKKLCFTILLSISFLGVYNYTHADITSNLSVWYTFDRNTIPSYVNTGKVFDMSGNNINGSLIIPIAPGMGSSTVGRIQQAIRFSGINNGTDSGMSLPASLAIGTGDLSISACVSSTGNNAFSNIISTYNSGAVNTGYAFYWNSTLLTWGVENTLSSPTSQVITATITQDGKYHSFVVTYTQAGTMNIYSDGVLKTTASSVPTGNITNAHAPQVGRSFASSPPQNISIDDLRVYARALTRNDAITLYRRCLATYGL